MVELDYAYFAICAGRASEPLTKPLNKNRAPPGKARIHSIIAVDLGFGAAGAAFFAAIRLAAFVACGVFLIAACFVIAALCRFVAAVSLRGLLAAVRFALLAIVFALSVLLATAGFSIATFSFGFAAFAFFGDHWGSSDEKQSKGSDDNLFHNDLLEARGAKLHWHIYHCAIRLNP